MCKICASCNGVMNYDPYFEAEVCGRCGKIERKSREEMKKKFSAQLDSNDILKQITRTIMVHL